jgi:hypothetical protein
MGVQKLKLRYRIELCTENGAVSRTALHLIVARLPTSNAFRSSISGLATKRFTSTLNDIIQGDSEISLEKKTIICDDEKKLTKFSYKSFFVFEIQMIENLVKIASTLLS